MGLDEDAGLALVGFAQVFAGGDGFGHALFEVGGVGDAGAVGAAAAEIGQAVGFRGVEAIDGLGQHQRQRVFACSARAGQDQRMGKTAGAHALAQVRDGGRVAEKILKAHGLRIVHGLTAERRLGRFPRPTRVCGSVARSSGLWHADWIWPQACAWGYRLLPATRAGECEFAVSHPFA